MTRRPCEAPCGDASYGRLDLPSGYLYVMSDAAYLQ